MKETFKSIIGSPTLMLGLLLSCGAMAFWVLIIPATLLLVIGALTPLLTEYSQSAQKLKKFEERINTIEKRISFGKLGT